MNILRTTTSILALFIAALASASAQQAVAHPPNPTNGALANAQIMKLIQARIPESVVLEKILAATNRFDTSTDALIALKKAGATDAELSAIMSDETVEAKPADSGPSLAVTMKFLQDKLNDIGKVTFVLFYQNTIVGTGSNTWTYEVSNVVADPSQCRITTHWKITRDGRTLYDSDNGFRLRDIQDVVVEPYVQYENRAGNPDMVTTSINPPVTALLARGPHGSANWADN
jgi:hypothetical protein